MFTKKNLFNLLPIIFILLIAAVVRLLWVNLVPNGISGDELTYIINAKAIWLTGSDISGTWNPLSVFLFNYPAYTTPQAELPYFVLAPIVGITQFSLFNSRIIFIIFSILSTLLIYLVSKELFNREVGIIAGLISAINPWLIYIGRTSYESSLMLFFFLLGLYVLLIAKGNKLLIAIPVFFLAFYSYIGTKLLFIPFVLMACLYSYFVINKKKYFKQYLVVFLSSFFLVVVFVFAVTSNPSRLGELFLPSDPVIAKQVDLIRKESIQTPFTNVFENKYTMYLRIILTKVFKSFASDYLFVSGDNFFSIIRNGMFYVLDAFFILMGLAAAYAKHKKAFWFILSMVFIGLIPQVFHTASIENFVYHLGMMFPFLIILIAVGIWEVVKLFKNKMYFYISSVTIFILYLFLLFNFLNIYFYQFSLMGFFDFNLRIVSNYVTLAKENNKKIIIYSHSSADIFKKYIFYTNNYNKNTIQAIKIDYKTNKFQFQNVTFLGCDNTINPKLSKDIIIYEFQCGGLKNNLSHLAISRLSDGGQSYEIFNDSLCSNYNLKTYPSNIKLSDFSIENQTSQKFCETFITR